MISTNHTQSQDSSVYGPSHPYWMDFSVLHRHADTIARAYHSRNLVFFIGAGASKYHTTQMPTWAELLEDLVAEIQLDNSVELAEVLRLINNKRYPLAIEAIKQYAFADSIDSDMEVDRLVARIIRQRLARSSSNPLLHLAILDFSVPIFTTNYDNIIESLLEEYSPSNYRKTALTYQDEIDAAEYLSPWPAQENYVFKLHGSIDRVQHLSNYSKGM